MCNYKVYEEISEYLLEQKIDVSICPFSLHLNADYELHYHPQPFIISHFRGDQYNLIYTSSLSQKGELFEQLLEDVKTILSNISGPINFRGFEETISLESCFGTYLRGYIIIQKQES